MEETERKDIPLAVPPSLLRSLSLPLKPGKLENQKLGKAVTLSSLADEVKSIEEQELWKEAWQLVDMQDGKKKKKKKKKNNFFKIYFFLF